MNSQCLALEPVCHLYNYIFQHFHSFGNDPEAFKYIKHYDKETCKMVCSLLSREIRKKHVFKGSTPAYFNKVQIAGRQVGFPLQSFFTVFQLQLRSAAAQVMELKGYYSTVQLYVRRNTNKCLAWARGSYKLITMEEAVLHQNEELSCSTLSNLEDLPLWPR